MSESYNTTSIDATLNSTLFNHQYSSQEPITALRDELESFAGAPITDFWLDGRFRKAVKHDKKNRVWWTGKTGIHPDGTPWASGYAIDHRTGGEFRWHSSRDFHELDRAKKAFAHRKRIHRQQELEKQKAQAERDKLYKEQVFQEQKAEWENGSTASQSAYLERKQVADCADAVADLRFFNGFIRIALRNAKGEIVGFQTLFDDGEKRVRGIQKGSFTIIGTLPSRPDKHEQPYVVEGLATGLAVYKATGRAVIVAIAAGNLSKVLRAINIQRDLNNCPKLKPIFAADSDLWKANQLHNGKPLGNTGLIKSHDTALIHRCMVVAPDFTGLDTSSKPTDFNDLLCLAGIDEVRRQLENVTEAAPYYAFFHERQDAAKQERELFAGHKLITINERYLPDTLPDDDEGDVRTLNEIIAKYRITLIKSGIGSGKTQKMKSFIDFITRTKHYSVIVISTLVSLIEQLVSRLGLESYHDYRGDELETMRVLQKLAICLNSLPKLKQAEGTKMFDVVIIDEIESVLQRLTTSIENKKLVYDVLRYLIANAKHTIVLDAHIGEVTMSTLRRWCPNEKFFCLSNTYQVGTGRKVIVYESKADLLHAALKASQEDKPVYITANSKTQAARNHAALKHAGKHGLKITSENRASAQPFLDDPNTVSKSLDYLAVSPAVSTGLSIDNGHFQFVAGIFNANTNTPRDCLQAIGRVRDSKEIHIYIDKKHNSLPVNRKVIRARWNEATELDYKYAGLNYETGEMEPISKDYAQLKEDVTFAQNRAKNDFYGNMLLLLDADGYEITHYRPDEETREAAKIDAENAQELEKQAYLDGIVSAPKLSDEERANLEKKHAYTDEETSAIIRYDIKKEYQLSDDISNDELREIAESDERGDTRKQIKRLELALANDAKVHQLRDEQDRRIDFQADKKNYFFEREFYRRVLKAVGFSFDNNQITYDQRTYNAESSALELFTSWVLAHTSALQAIIKLPSSVKLKNQPVKFLGNQLRKLGLDQHSIGRTSKGNYTIDPVNLKVMLQILEKRKTAPASLLASIARDTDA